ncbi:DUF6086 family protein [Streptomyces sp. NPDC056387]|uniref:DUF6086 family protein n=1 Tax=Streptomyces sp. NPDC056387 TaxID=3345803 RepID=UPI0035D6EACE
MFLHHVAAFEAELQLPTDVGPTGNDERRIDPAAFEAFVYAQPTRHRGTARGRTRPLRGFHRHGAGPRRTRRNQRGPDGSSHAGARARGT